MSDKKNVVEQHGCLVCGKVYSLLVVYSASGTLVDCTVTSSGGQRVRNARRPLVACTTHTAAEIETAYAKRYPGAEQEDDDEREDG